MSCKDVAKLLPLFLDEELTAKERERVTTHLATCANCQQLLDAYRRDQEILRSLSPVEPPPNWRAQLMDRVNGTSKKGQRQFPAWKFFVPRLGSLAAALLVVLLVTNIYIFPSYLAEHLEEEPLPEMRIMSSTEQENHGVPAEPDTASKDDPPTEIAIAGWTAADLQKDARSLATNPADQLQKRWWFWSSTLGVFIWLTAAAYYYYRYRRILKEQTD
ncbi:MAG: hypothetical protein GX033_03870 [Firmicutes bacterium]|nr:hypothetical protein [Bacillota bacterium]